MSMTPLRLRSSPHQFEDSIMDHHRAISQNPSSTLMFVSHTIPAIDVPADSIDVSSVVVHHKKFSSEAQRLRNNCLQRRTDRKRRLKEGCIMNQLRALIAESEINEEKEKEGREREGITRVQIIEKSALVIKMLNDKINELNKSLNNPSVNEREGVYDQQSSLSSTASGGELSAKRRRMHSLDLSNADDSCQSLISTEPTIDDSIIDDPHSNTSDSSQQDASVNDLVLLSTLQSSLSRVQSIHDRERCRYQSMMVYGASLLSSSHQVFLIDIVGRTLECPRTDLGALKDYNLGRVMYNWITMMHAVLHSFVPYFYSTPFPYLIDAKFLQDKHSSSDSRRGENVFNAEEGSNVSDDRLMQWTQLAASILSFLLQSFDREEDFQKFLYGLLFNQRGGVKPLPRPIVDLHMKFPNIEAERLFVSFASFLPTKAFFQSMATLYSGQSSAPIACPMLSIAADGVGIKEFCISPVIRPRANHANILQGFMVIPLHTLQRFDAGHVKKTIISTLFKSGMMMKAPGINLMNEKIR